MIDNQLNWSKDNFENIETAWEGDLWDRRRLGEQLTNYVDRLNCGAVLALDARWGEGKTWFVRHWAKHLDDTQHNVIYLDAFANDYLEDPFLTIAAEISQTFKELEEIDDDEIKDFNAKTASVLISLAAVIPMIAAKAGMHWIGLGGAGEAFKEVYEEGKALYDTASEEIAAKVKEKIEKKIENYQVEKQTIHDFKKELAVLAGKLDKPLVFIIDELDRCRPDFAIRLIERIKHFFDIPKIVFVLVMNKPQLLQSVKSYYGYDSEMNGDYLEKFVDFTIHLSNEGDIYDFEEVIKYELFRIGELKSINDRNELFYWLLGLQLDKRLNSRELIKKLNQYALLRTSNQKKNLILLSLIMGQKPYVNYHIFIQSIVKKINEYLCTNKRSFMQRHNLSTWGSNGISDIEESEWFRLILEKDLDIKDTFIDKILSAYDNAKKSKDPEYQLINVLKDVSISELDHSNNFIKDWQSYIDKGL
ncbi:P-loop NTPase fold protein [Acinetobacter sp. YH12227]|uniref:KAP family P-loop NTPase fold protein n=1 Tax=Acinetobacter sp. YH12227 TaxID=2601158 RepID=UPI0015D3C4B6|nr:P-loop NTPase fold protein [Acinetobacter sp. YH12227]